MENLPVEVLMTMTTVNPNPGVIAREIDKQLVLYDPKKDAVHTLNPTAQFVWERLTLDLDQIAEELQNTYQVSADTALQDINAIISQFQSLGLLNNNPPQ